MPPARPLDNVLYLRTHRPFRVLGSVDTVIGQPRDYAEPQFVRPISEEHIARSLGEYEPLNLNDALAENMQAEPFRYGLADAIADFIADPRFIVGFMAGTFFTVAAAWVIALVAL